MQLLGSLAVLKCVFCSSLIIAFPISGYMRQAIKNCLVPVHSYLNLEIFRNTFFLYWIFYCIYFKILVQQNHQQPNKLDATWDFCYKTRHIRMARRAFSSLGLWHPVGPTQVWKHLHGLRQSGRYIWMNYQHEFVCIVKTWFKIIKCPDISAACGDFQYRTWVFFHLVNN